MISSSESNLLFVASSVSSIEVSPNSFSIIAIFFPWLAERMWLRSVVFPLPRKPVRMVTGTRVSMLQPFQQPVTPATAEDSGRAHRVS